MLCIAKILIIINFNLLENVNIATYTRIRPELKLNTFVIYLAIITAVLFIASHDHTSTAGYLNNAITIR